MNKTKIKPQHVMADWLPDKSVISVEIAHCSNPQHGEYQAVHYHLGGKERFVGCPRCLEEDMRHQQNEYRRQLQCENAERELVGRRKRANLRPRNIDDRFENYSTCDKGQRHVLDIAVAYVTNAEEVLRVGTCMIFVGGPGTGKTKLAAAIANALLESGFQPLYLTMSELRRRVQSTYSRNSRVTTEQVIHELVAVDLLIIDEIGASRGTDDELNILQELIDERYAHRRPNILISNLAPDDLTALVGDRVIDRLRDGGGKYLAFNWGSFRGKNNRRTARNKD